jgi:hypothetical protein
LKIRIAEPKANATAPEHVSTVVLIELSFPSLQEPPPLASAFIHFSEYLPSHLVKSGGSPVLIALEIAFCRQAKYLPAILFLEASHFSAGVIARTGAATATATASKTMLLTNLHCKCPMIAPFV